MSRQLLATVGILIASVGFAADDPRTFEGTWVNRKYNTNGTMKCVASPQKDGTWKATFSGKFMGDPFSYDITFQSKAGKEQLDIGGPATIRNHKYGWAGTLKGDTLSGRYRSNSGYFGEFVLKEVKAEK